MGGKGPNLLQSMCAKDSTSERQLQLQSQPLQEDPLDFLPNIHAEDWSVKE